MDQQDRFNPKRINHSQALGERINQPRRTLRSHHRVGVPVKRDRHCYPCLLLRVLNGLAQDTLMAQVNAVKHAQGQTRLPISRCELTGLANDVHPRVPRSRSGGEPNNSKPFATVPHSGPTSLNTGMTRCSRSLRESLRTSSKRIAFVTSNS